MDVRTAETLDYPFPTPPAPGEIIEVAPGILWVRMPLPFRLNHVNIYLIEDGDGWAVLDAGIGNDTTRAIWEALVTGPLAGRRLTRAIISHYHPDHIGLAGWLAQRFELPLLMSQTSYLGCLNISLSPGALDARPYRDFYSRNGLDAKTTDIVATQGHGYLRMVTPLPPTFSRVVAGDTLRIGGRAFSVLTGDGHAPEQIMLYCAAEKLFLAADQVIAKDFAQCQRLGRRSVGRSARALSAIAQVVAARSTGGRARVVGASTAVLWHAYAHRRTDRASRDSLRGDRRTPAAPPRDQSPIWYRDLSSSAGSASDELRVQRSLRACELHDRRRTAVWTDPQNGTAVSSRRE